ncbi:MAG: HAD family phosphatase [Pseudomonadota bacterium]
MHLDRFSAIIFDCDGVLVDSEALGLDDSVAFLKSRGFTWEAPDLIRIFTGYRDDIFRQKLEDAYIEIHGQKPDNTLFEGLIETRRRNKHKLKAIAGAEPFLQSLRNQHPNLAIGVASSSRTPLLTSKLERTGLWDLLAPHIYSADRVAEGKPAPDVFLYAAEKLGIDPGACLVLEDSTQGIKAGLAAGMTVWGFTGGSHCFDGHAETLIDAGAERIVNGFAELDRLILGKAV